MSLRKIAIKNWELKKEYPELGIVFCGNRAVVSFRSYKQPPDNHTDVYYGAFFKIRLGIACMKVLYLSIT